MRHAMMPPLPNLPVTEVLPALRGALDKGRNAVLVAPRARVQDVRKLVARIKAAGRDEHIAPATPKP